jgi:hypothetical protein
VPPPLTEHELGHFVACHRATELSLKGAFEQRAPEDRAAEPVQFQSGRRQTLVP